MPCGYDHALKLSYASSSQHMTDWSTQRTARWYDKCIASSSSLADGSVRYIFAVADAVAQQKISAAGRAAQLSIMTCQDNLDLIPCTTDLQVENSINSLFMIINQAIRAVGTQENDDIRTGLTAGFVLNDKLYLGHIGNGRVYRFRDGELRVMSEETSLKLSPPEKTPIASGSSLGESDEPRISFFRYAILPGDIYMLCTDGLYNNLSDEEIGSILISSQSPTEKCENFMDQVKLGSLTDDATVVLFQAEGGDRSSHTSDKGEGVRVYTVPLDAHEKWVGRFDPLTMEIDGDEKKKKTLFDLPFLRPLRKNRRFLPGVGIVLLLVLFALLLSTNQAMNFHNRLNRSKEGTGEAFLNFQSKLMLEKVVFNSQNITDPIKKNHLRAAIKLDENLNEFAIEPMGNYRVEMLMGIPQGLEFLVGKETMAVVKDKRVIISVRPTSTVGYEYIQSENRIKITVTNIDGVFLLNLAKPDSMEFRILEGF